MYAPPYTGPPPPPGAESPPKVKSAPWAGNSSARGAIELIKERKRYICMCRDIRICICPHIWALLHHPGAI